METVCGMKCDVLRRSPFERSRESTACTNSVPVFVHEHAVGLRQELEGICHGVFGWQECSSEVQGALFLPEAASRHKDNPRFVQDLFHFA